MTVSCPDCRSVFRVDPAKVPATGVRARCSVCGGVITIAAGTLPVSVTPASQSAVGSGMPARGAQPTPQRPYTPAVASRTAPRATPAMPTSAPDHGAIAARAHMPLTDADTARLSHPTPVMGNMPAAAADRSVVSPMGRPTPSSVTAHSHSAGTPPAPLSTATLTPRRSINPFLNADPGQRARRLARALVSDLVAYHPQKREEGLREGTLRQLFREDIKKSYEEYVEQVGREVAEGSPHFQEALNEILGGGHRLF